MTRPLRVDEVVALAQKAQRGRASIVEVARLATAILDLLAEAPDCGWEEPVLVKDSEGRWLVEVPDWHDTIDSTDARHLMRLLAHAADKADAADEAGKEGK